MELSAALAERRSTRAYTTMSVSDADLDDLIKAATFAPSAMNEQPCHFTVITKKQVLEAISKAARQYALEEFSKGSHIDHLREMLSDPHFDIFYGAPALVVISAPSASQWTVEDCALAAENLMLAATDRRLGSCWIGFAQPWLATSDGHRAIGLSSELTPVAPIIIGHPQSVVPPVPRRTPRTNHIR